MQETPVQFLERSTGEGIGYPLQYSWASLVAQLVKNLPTMWENWIRSLDWEDPLEKEKKIPIPVVWPRECRGLTKSWTQLSNFPFHEWEYYSNYFGEGVKISRNWATTQFLVF